MAGMAGLMLMRCNGRGLAPAHIQSHPSRRRRRPRAQPTGATYKLTPGLGHRQDTVIKGRHLPVEMSPIPITPSSQLAGSMPSPLKMSTISSHKDACTSPPSRHWTTWFNTISFMSTSSFRYSTRETSGRCTFKVKSREARGRRCPCLCSRPCFMQAVMSVAHSTLFKTCLYGQVTNRDTVHIT